MRLTTNFTLEEFVVTQHRGIDNDLPMELFDDARNTCGLLERIRSFLSLKAKIDVPILLSSGYRCLALNRAIGSSDTSDHIKAKAADFIAPKFSNAYGVAAALAGAVDELVIVMFI
jgi:uncharacterized protein YcbK (DUF882 family)